MHKAGETMNSEVYFHEDGPIRSWSCDTCLELMQVDWLSCPDLAPRTYVEDFAADDMREHGYDTCEDLLKAIKDKTHPYEKFLTWQRESRKGPRPGESQKDFYHRLSLIRG